MGRRARQLGNLWCKRCIACVVAVCVVVVMWSCTEDVSKRARQLGNLWCKRCIVSIVAIVIVVVLVVVLVVRGRSCRLSSWCCYLFVQAS